MHTIICEKAGLQGFLLRYVATHVQIILYVFLHGHNASHCIILQTSLECASTSKMYNNCPCIPMIIISLPPPPPHLLFSSLTQLVLQMLLEICQAAHSCHSRRIIHRDLKPENILLDDRRRVKLGKPTCCTVLELFLYEYIYIAYFLLGCYGNLCLCVHNVFIIILLLFFFS